VTAGAALACSPLSAGVSSTGSGVRSGDATPRWNNWLCSPTAASHDWCRVSLSITVVKADGLARVDVLKAPKTRPVDCFYVYPTASLQMKGNADLHVDEVQKLVALKQAAPFERVCRVFAPMYRQVTGYASGFDPSWDLAYGDVRAAWRDYLAHDNHGRGVVLIGHSQGSYHLTRLLREEIEPRRPVRRLLVSALLLGGNVTVAKGSDTGGDFKSVPACRKAKQTGCVVAYSTWDRPPPKNPRFDKEQQGKQMLCVNPAALGGGTARITPVFVWFDTNGLAPVSDTRPETNYIAFPDLYKARCVRRGSQAWLLVERATTASDPRPTVQGALGPGRGLHAADVNIALGDLVALVRSQGKSWVAHR
jgi:pimeloyl-ACP methyl ester carboxylesterase